MTISKKLCIYDLDSRSWAETHRRTEVVGASSDSA